MNARRPLSDAWLFGIGAANVAACVVCACIAAASPSWSLAPLAIGNAAVALLVAAYCLATAQLPKS